MATDILIDDITPRIQYTGDGAQTAFTYPFPIFADGDIEVYLDTTLKTITTDYTVAGAGDSAGGSVTMLAAPANGAVVTLVRNIPIKRTTDFQEGGEFRAKVINDELDKMTAGLQQVEVEAGRGLKLSPTDTASSVTLPDKAARLGMLLGFNAVTGDPEATAGVAGPTGATGAAGADGIFSGAEVTVTPATVDKLAVLDVSDTDNPKYVTVQSVLDLVPTPSTVDIIARESLALNYFLDAVDHARVYSSMVDGVVDAFTDETGVDVATSANELYDTTNDLYANFSLIDEYTPSIAVTYTYQGMYAGFVETDGQAFNIATARTIRGVDFYLKKIGAPTGNMVAKLYAATGTVGSTATPTGGVLATSAVVDITTLTTSEQAIRFTFSGGYSATSGDYCIFLEYSGGDGSNLLQIATDNISPTHAGNSFTSTAAAGPWTVQATYDTLFRLLEVEAASMTLQSNAFASSVTDPTTGHIVVFEEDVDAVTLNTDLIASVSRDGGTTWTAAVLVLQGTYATGKNILTAEVDISAQPAGSSMKWKIVTANTKEMKIHGAALQWRV